MGFKQSLNLQLSSLPPHAVLQGQVWLSILFFPNPASDSALVCRGQHGLAPASVAELRLLVTGHCTDMPPASPAQPADLLDPRPQVWGALVEADGLEEVLLAARHHHPAVEQAEGVEQGRIQVGFPAGAGRAAGVVLPGDALKANEGGKGSGLAKMQETEEDLYKWDAFRPAAAI